MSFTIFLSASPIIRQKIGGLAPGSRVSVASFGERIPVTVSAELPTEDNALAKGVWSDGSSLAQGSTWPAYVEKALAQYYHDGNGPNGQYAGVEGDYVERVVPYLTGTDAEKLSSTDAVADALAAGKTVTVSTTRVNKEEVAAAGLGKIYASHAYTIESLENGQFRLRNPWGTNHPNPMTAAQLDQFFGGYTAFDAG